MICYKNEFENGTNSKHNLFGQRGNEPLDFLKCEEFLGKLSDHQLLKNSCAAWNWL
jgi:hypothetical protein